MSAFADHRLWVPVAAFYRSTFSRHTCLFPRVNTMQLVSAFVPWHRLCVAWSLMTCKVLLIEDNTDCRELLAMLIRHLGFDVVEADDGEIGVQKALAEKPDLILMDLGMPSMSGIQATACLREMGVTRNIPVVIYTAWTAECHRDAALRSGADAVINKPISLHQLQSTLLRYLPIPGRDRDAQ